MALPHFIASVKSTRQISNLLYNCQEDLDYELACTEWTNITKRPPPLNSVNDAGTWSGPIFETKLTKVRSAQQAQAAMARLVAACYSDLTLLFKALPNSKDGTRLSDATFTTAVGLRLGLPVATTGRCIFGEELDALGEHALVCKRGASRTARHTKSTLGSASTTRGRLPVNIGATLIDQNRWQKT